jgi:hypothetical protein
MKVKLRQVVEGQQALAALLEVKYPFLVSWKLGKAAKLIDKETANFKEETNKIILERGEKSLNEDGTPKLDKNGQESYSIKDPEKLEEFLAEQKATLDEEIELNIAPVNIKDLEKCEVPPVVTYLLDFLFTDEE